MPFKIKFDEEGRRFITEKLEEMEREELVTIYKEWLALENARKRLKDKTYMDCDMEDFEAIKQYIEYYQDKFTIGHLVDEITLRVFRVNRCEKGNEAWLCPFGCHTVILL